jgi:hypothetical protein
MDFMRLKGEAKINREKAKKGIISDNEFNKNETLIKMKVQALLQGTVPSTIRPKQDIQIEKQLDKYGIPDQFSKAPISKKEAEREAIRKYSEMVS